jgi:hypothetical protein
VVRDRTFTTELKSALKEMIEHGARPVPAEHWQSRPRLYKAAIWVAYGIVRLAMGFLGYGGEEWFPRRPKGRAESA